MNSTVGLTSGAPPLVWMKTGREVTLVIHIEVQGYVDDTFAERMWIYFYRLYDRYRSSIVSLALLSDDRDSFRPSSYSLESHGTRLQFDFPIAKLRDFRQRVDELESSENPLALIVLGLLERDRGQRGRRARSPQEFRRRLERKIQLIARMYERHPTRRC